MTHKKLASLCNRLPEVAWDRCVIDQEQDCGMIFGWIARPDGRSDFCVIRWDEEGVSCTTSSAALCAEFGRRLFGTRNRHRDCERVEDVLGDLIHNPTRRN